MKHINYSESSLLLPLFCGQDDTMIRSFFDGIMGCADASDSLSSARIINADFMFLGGKPDDKLLCDFGGYSNNYIIMTPPSDAWAAAIERVHGKNCRCVTRYAIKKQPDVFDRARLLRYIDELPPEYSVKLFDRDIYTQCAAEHWSDSLCGGMNSADEFFRIGLGAAVTANGRIVSGASSYSVYNGGIEIEIDTHPEYRRRHLALAAASRLIIECLDRKLYPSWDAQNLGSVALSGKLGYEFDHEYPAYEVSL